MQRVPVFLIIGLILAMALTLARPRTHTDEIATVLSVNAHKTEEILNYLRSDTPKTLGNIRSFVFFNPQATMKKAFERHLTEEPQFSPLYSLMARAWSQIIPETVEIVLRLRIFSFLAALLSFYFLVKVFQSICSRRVSHRWILLGLLSSPALWILAREARVYSFWVLAIGFSWWALTKILEQADSKKFFVLWVIAHVVGINLQILHIFVFLPQLLFLLFAKKTSSRLPLMGALVLVLGSYLPWAVRAYFSTHVTSNMAHVFSENHGIAVSLVKTALRSFWDFNIGTSADLVWQRIFSLAGLGFLFLLGTLAWGSARALAHTQRLWLVVFLGPIFLMVASDLGLKTSFCNLQRYLLPLTLGVLIVAALIVSENVRFPRLGRLAIGLWVLGGMASVIQVAREPIWRTHPYGAENRYFVEHFEDKTFVMGEFFAHLNQANPGSSDFIKTLILLSRLEAFRAWVPSEKQPLIKW